MTPGNNDRRRYVRRFWRDRPVFVTGATGLVGGAIVRHLVEAGADVVCLVRDWVPRSELVASGLIERVRVVRGDVVDAETIERALGEYEVVTVLHLAAQAIVGVANRNPVSTLESNIRGTWALLEACRRSPLVKQIVVASSDKAYGDQDVLPYREDAPVLGRHPYDVSKSCADLHRADVCEELRPAGVRHPVRQLLRRRRPELESSRARHDPFGRPQRAARDPLRRALHPRLHLRGATGRAPIRCWPSGSARTRSSPAKCSTSPTSAG